jgi:hypothetical protein
MRDRHLKFHEDRDNLGRSSASPPVGYLGSAIAAWVSRGKEPPFYVACPVFTGLG